MGHWIGLILLWGAWIYVACAIFYARRTYKKILSVDPGYFSSTESSLVRMLNWQSSLGVMKFIDDPDINSRGYTSDLVVSIKHSKMMYAAVPFAIILFIVGIALS